MRKIGLFSDTHSYFDPRIKNFFNDCDEIWHAGDIGNLETSDLIAAFKPLRAVYGNIDGQELRICWPGIQDFMCEEIRVFMTHIGGYPGRYEREAARILTENPPDLFISGHSHILKVMPDKKLNLLHINPGAAGKSGLHQVCTAVRFIIDGRKIKELEIWEATR